MEDIVTPRKRCRTLSSLTALKTVNPNLSPECNSVGLVPTKNIDNISEESTRERTSSFVIQRENFSILGTPRSGCGRIAQASTLMLSKIPVKLSSSREKLFENVITKNYKKDQRRLLIFAVLMKIFVISLALGAYYSQKSFDISGDVFVDFYKNSSPIQGGVNNFWKKFEGYFMDSMKPFVRWDALYFLGISEHGYTFEQQHAFFPFFPILIRGIRDSLLAPLSTVLCPMARSILAGFLISNISFVLAAISVYKYPKTNS